MKEADFYAVQCFYDGFGNDTLTLAVFPTETEAQAWCDQCNKEHKPTVYCGKAEVVPQWYGEYHNSY